MDTPKDSTWRGGPTCFTPEAHAVKCNVQRMSIHTFPEAPAKSEILFIINNV
jgi:hypothetical protein